MASAKACCPGTETSAEARRRAGGAAARPGGPRRRCDVGAGEPAGRATGQRPGERLVGSRERVVVESPHGHHEIVGSGAGGHVEAHPGEHLDVEVGGHGDLRREHAVDVRDVRLTWSSVTESWYAPGRSSTRCRSFTPPPAPLAATPGRAPRRMRGRGRAGPPGPVREGGAGARTDPSADPAPWPASGGPRATAATKRASSGTARPAHARRSRAAETTVVRDSSGRSRRSSGRTSACRRRQGDEGAGEHVVAGGSQAGPQPGEPLDGVREGPFPIPRRRRGGADRALAGERRREGGGRRRDDAGQRRQPQTGGRRWRGRQHHPGDLRVVPAGRPQPEPGQHHGSPGELDRRTDRSRGGDPLPAAGHHEGGRHADGARAEQGHDDRRCRRVKAGVKAGVDGVRGDCHDPAGARRALEQRREADVGERGFDGHLPCGHVPSSCCRTDAVHSPGHGRTRSRR